jgi:hypothetical protein
VNLLFLFALILPVALAICWLVIMLNKETVALFSRYVIPWQLSNTLYGLFCLETLDLPLSRGQSDILTNQGAQFTIRDLLQSRAPAPGSIASDPLQRCICRL